jgi:hypothetical protein
MTGYFCVIFLIRGAPRRPLLRMTGWFFGSPDKLLPWLC